MKKLEKIEDYLKLLKNFDALSNSKGMKDILSAVGPGEHYLKSWNCYAIFFLKNEMKELANSFNTRADRVYVVERISSYILTFPSFAKVVPEELSSFLGAVAVFKETKTLSSSDQKMLNEKIQLITKAINAFLPEPEKA
ncbi:MAG: hypothetical protein ACK5N8_01220 [Alphaproteobacteria bacterium]